MKAIAGIVSERKLPAFASKTFKQRFREREPRNPQGTPVILWADTFNNHFLPETGEAAVEVLEDAGFRVEVPEQPLCCGRPLYDYGMLDLAEAYLRKVLSALREEIRAGTPVVGIEPSCVAVFKDELLNMRPNDEDARRLSQQTYHFAEFVHHVGYEPPPLHRKAVLHEHCHQHATGGIAPDRQLLEAMGVEVQVPESGCCGMAGAWGYEEGHYDVSMACGERVLLPKVREAEADTLVVTAGFSCRSQIEQTTERRALHVAQVIQLARDYGASGPGASYPERAAAPKPRPASSRRPLATAAAAAALGAGAVAFLKSRA